MKKKIEIIIAVSIAFAVVVSFKFFLEVVDQQAGEGKYLIVVEDGYLQYYHAKYGKWPSDLNEVPQYIRHDMGDSNYSVVGPLRYGVSYVIVAYMINLH